MSSSPDINPIFNNPYEEPQAYYGMNLDGLSAAIHTANADEQIILEAKAKILKHFEALRTFEIDLTKVDPELKSAPEP